MNARDEINLMVKKAESGDSIVPIEGRPLSGRFVGKENSYSISPKSDGRFFRVLKGNGRPSDANVYLRRNGRTQNFGVETPGKWSSDAIRSLAGAVYSKGSPLLDKNEDGTIIGVPREQFEREVASHNYLQSGEDYPLRYPLAASMAWLESKLKNERDPFHVTDMRKSNGGFDQTVHRANAWVSRHNFDKWIRDSVRKALRYVNMATSAGR